MTKDKWIIVLRCKMGPEDESRDCIFFRRISPDGGVCWANPKGLLIADPQGKMTIELAATMQTDLLAASPEKHVCGRGEWVNEAGDIVGFVEYMKRFDVNFLP